MFNSASGNLLFSTNMTVSQHFLPFRELFSDPGAVPDCFGLPCFRNLVAWNLVDKRVRKCFNVPGILEQFTLTCCKDKGLLLSLLMD